MIAKLMHHVRKWIEEREQRRNAKEEYRGYEYAMRSIFQGIPVRLVEQEVEDRIYFSRGSGHFEKGMLNFLENKKGMDLVFQERRNHEHE
jgi:hypothetical protein